MRIGCIQGRYIASYTAATVGVSESMGPEYSLDSRISLAFSPEPAPSADGWIRGSDRENNSRS